MRYGETTVHIVSGSIDRPPAKRPFDTNMGAASFAVGAIDRFGPRSIWQRDHGIRFSP
jgi:hypothetical protein